MALLRDKMTQRINCFNKTIGLIHCRDFLAIQIDIPNIQRIRDDDKVAEIINYQTCQLKQYGRYNFLGLINIHFCVETNEYLLVDGQHRYESLTTLAKDKNFEIAIEVVQVETREELKSNYELINKNTPLPQFSERINKNIPETVALYFKKEFPDIWSKNARARRPHLYFNHFQEALGFLTEYLDIHNAQILQNLVLDYNSKLSKWDKTAYPDSKSITEKIASKCSSEGFFLGLYKHVSDNYGYDWVRDIIKQEKGVQLAKTKKQSIRKKNIPKCVKMSVWNNCVGKEFRRAKCICCNNKAISVEDFHAGHIIPESQGGSASIDNLLPICSACNLSMGANNMRNFIMEYYPQQIGHFDSKRCAKETEPKVNNTDYFLGGVFGY